MRTLQKQFVELVDSMEPADIIDGLIASYESVVKEMKEIESSDTGEYEKLVDVLKKTFTAVCELDVGL